MIEHQSYALRGSQVFMHGEPDFQVEADLAWQDWHELAAPCRDLSLTAGDTDAGSECRKLSRVAVGPEPECVTGNAHASVADGGERGAVAVEANQSMVSEVSDTLRRSPCLDVRAMREEADTHDADFLCNDGSLGRTSGSHGDIGVAA